MVAVIGSQMTQGEGALKYQRNNELCQIVGCYSEYIRPAALANLKISIPIFISDPGYSFTQMPRIEKEV